MEELRNYLQSVLFGRFVEDVKFYVTQYKSLPEEEKRAYYSSMVYTEYFGSFNIQYTRNVEMRAVDDGKLSIKVSFCKGVIKTSGGIYLSEFEPFARYYTTTIEK